MRTRNQTSSPVENRLRRETARPVTAPIYCTLIPLSLDVSTGLSIPRCLATVWIVNIYGTDTLSHT